MVPTHSVSVGHPPPALERTALELAYESLPPVPRQQAVDDLSNAAARGERSLAGLFAAWRRDEVLGAVLSEIMPGESASLWPARLAQGSPLCLAEQLLKHALDWLESQGVEMVQCVLTTDSGEDAERLRSAGFAHPCDLLCLVSNVDRFPTAPIATDLAFCAVPRGELSALTDIIEETYEQTLDCPALDARRDCRQAVAGYAATCRDDLSHWYLVRHHQECVGCLLLGHEASGKTWELVYMGLVPGGRGRGWGIDMVRQAQWLVREEQGERLLLAVDAANDPALRIYAAAGFITWDRRSVFIKMLSSSRE